MSLDINTIIAAVPTFISIGTFCYVVYKDVKKTMAENKGLKLEKAIVQSCWKQVGLELENKQKMANVITEISETAPKLIKGLDPKQLEKIMETTYQTLVKPKL
jgi:hypothetical protein